MIHRSLAVACLLAVALTGCSSSRSGSVTFTSAETGATLSQSFNNAYIAQVGQGEYEILLIDSAADWDYKLPKARRNRPIDPIDVAPLRQAMRIHMFWRPLKMVSQNPAAINASIDWYVLGPEGSDDILVYEGAAYVSIDGFGGKRTVRIRDGQIKPVAARGEFQDPIGPASIRGSAAAVINTARVNETLADLRQQAQRAGTRMDARSAESTPRE